MRVLEPEPLELPGARCLVRLGPPNLYTSCTARGGRHHPTVGRSHNPSAERLIGAIRRDLLDLLDHVIVFGERHLLRLLKIFFADHYHDCRCHQALDSSAPKSTCGPADDQGPFADRNERRVSVR